MPLSVSRMLCTSRSSGAEIERARITASATEISEAGQADQRCSCRAADCASVVSLLSGMVLTTNQLVSAICE